MAEASHPSRDGRSTARSTGRSTGRTAGRSTPAVRASVLDTVIGYRLRRAQAAVAQDFHDRFAPLDLRPAEASALALLEASPGIQQGVVAAILGIERANFVALIDRLESRGLAERRTGADRRSRGLWLTAAGIELAARMREVWAAHEAAWVERLGGAEERDRLIALLRRLAE